MIYFGYHEYINMYYNLIMLIIYEFVEFVEDDIFPLTLVFNLQLNCKAMTLLTLLVCELLYYDVSISIMNRFG